MSIELLCGLPGSGKSNTLLDRIVGDMRKDYACEIAGMDTNEMPYYCISLNMRSGEFLNYLIRNGIYVYDRLIYIPLFAASSRRYFWHTRGWGDMNPQNVSKDKNVEAWAFDWERENGGRKVSRVRYYLDEIHRDFRATDCTKTRPEMRDYMSQHEHVGDSILATVQDPDMVDVTWRRLTETFTLCGNAARKRAWGMRGPRLLSTFSYNDWPPRDKVTSVSTSVRRLDKELSACYKTAVTTRGSSDKARGLSIWWGAAGIIVVAALLWFSLPIAGYYLRRKTVAQPAPVHVFDLRAAAGDRPSVISQPLLPGIAVAAENAMSVTNKSVGPIAAVAAPIKPRVLAYWGHNGLVYVRTVDGIVQVDGAVGGYGFIFGGRFYEIGSKFP